MAQARLAHTYPRDADRHAPHSGPDAGRRSTERDAPARIRAAAERLIAERGVDVPLRDIVAAAGQRNNSVVQYHFGSRDNLIEAIVQHRTEALERRRLSLLAEAEAEGNGEDLRTLMDILVRPLLEVAAEHGATHYSRFLAQVRNHPAVADTARLDAEQLPAVRIVIARLERSLGDLPRPIRRLRLESLATVMFALLADHERLVESGATDAADAELALANLVDVLVALVTASPSPAVLEAVGRRHQTAVR